MSADYSSITNARWRNGDQDKDEGSFIQFAMQGLKEFGACSEKSWPFEKPLLLKKPDRDAYKQADQVKIQEMEQVPLELNAWKQALASGYPSCLAAGFSIPSMNAPHRGGVVPMPNPNDLARSSHGGIPCAPSGIPIKSRFLSCGIPGATNGVTRGTAICRTIT
jgi:hypothetical protein